jgi:anti-sigma B factor antagonist
MIYPGTLGGRHERFIFHRVGNRSSGPIAIAWRAFFSDVCRGPLENRGVVEQRFHIEELVEQGRPVVRVDGEIDVATAPQLRECLHGVIARGPSEVVIDLLGVTFLDSTALGVLVGALKRCREVGGELHLVVSDPRIMKIFEITGLDKVFPLSDSLASLGAS